MQRQPDRKRISSDEELRSTLECCLEYLDDSRRYELSARLSYCLDLLVPEFSADDGNAESSATERE